jgi:hypothetical protein
MVMLLVVADSPMLREAASGVETAQIDGFDRGAAPRRGAAGVLALVSPAQADVCGDEVTIGSRPPVESRQRRAIVVAY